MSRSTRFRPVLPAVLASALAAGVLALVPPASAAGAPPVPERVELPDGFGPEGVATSGTTAYATSLRGAGVYAADLRTGAGAPLVELPGYALRGAQVDEASGLLWVAGTTPSGGGLLVLDPAAEDPLVAEVSLSGSGFPNDLVVTDDAVWVTDSFRDWLYQVELDEDRRPTGTSQLPLSGDWEPTPAGAIAANGIRRLPGGELLVVDSRDGGLVAVDPTTGEAAVVPVTGGALSGGDGLVLRGRDLWVVSSDGGDTTTALRLSGRPGSWSAAVVGEPVGAEVSRPSTGALALSGLYVVNARFTTPGATEFWISRLPVR